MALKSEKSLLKVDLAWFKKYKPEKFEDVVLPIEVQTYFQKIFDTGAIPDLLLNSVTPGVGKSTLALLMADKLNYQKCYIDGSVDNGIGVVRSIIEPFVSQSKQRDTVGKIVIIEECDNLTIDAQKALRVIMDRKKNTCFILTCNYVSKLIDPLVSRLTTYNFDFNSSNVKQEMVPKIKERVINILEKETVEYNEVLIDKAITKCYPSIRNTIKALQQTYEERGNLLDENYIYIIDDQLMDAIKKFECNKIFKIMNESNISYSNIYRYLYDNLINTLSNTARIETILLLNKYQYQHSQVIDEQIHIMSLFVEISIILKKHKK